jgi:hypothetical protein
VDEAGWSSLEIAKLAVAAATPIVVILIGVVVSRAARRVEQAQWANRKLVERRLELYDDMARLLNDLYCFFMVVGHFREIAPPDAVRRKRELDRIFYVNEYLMGARFGELYREFVNACFDMYTGFAQDAKLRASVAAQRTERREWDGAWDGCFVADPTEVTAPDEVARRYRALMLCFADLIGVQPQAGTASLRT